MSLELARPPDAPASVGEPLQLQLSTTLTEELTPRPFAPLPLQLAIALPYLSPAVLPSQPFAAGGPAPKPVFYAVRVNREDQGVARLLVTADGRWLARRADLETWRLRLPNVAPVLYAGEAHYPLDAYSGLTI